MNTFISTLGTILLPIKSFIFSDSDLPYVVSYVFTILLFLFLKLFNENFSLLDTRQIKPNATIPIIIEVFIICFVVSFYVELLKLINFYIKKIKKQ